MRMEIRTRISNCLSKQRLQAQIIQERANLYAQKLDPTRLLIKIILGVKSKLEEEVRTILQCNPKLKHIRLFRAKKHPDLFEIVLEELPR